MTRGLGSSGARGIYITPETRKSVDETEPEKMPDVFVFPSAALQDIAGSLKSIAGSMAERDEGFMLLSQRLTKLEIQQAEDARTAKARTDNYERVLRNEFNDAKVMLERRIIKLENKTLWQRIFRWR